MNKKIYNQKGFSLFELMVVVAIIAVAAGIILPVYFSMKPTIRINGAARQIMGDLMWAKMRAVSENNDYVITFGEPDKILTNNTYYIYDDDDGDLDLEKLDEDNAKDKLVKTVVISDEYKGVGYGFVAPISKATGGTLNAGDEPVTFNSGGGEKPIWFKFESNGRNNISGGIYIILDEDEANGSKERSRAITVKTGRVRIYNYNAGSGEWE